VRESCFARNVFSGFIGCILLVPALGSFALADMYIKGNDPTLNRQRYDRFYSGSDKAFIGEGLDFSGVSVDGRRATMISSQYFITAYHWPATARSNLTFFEGNTTGSGGHVYDVDTSFNATMYYNGQPADVFLGRLTEPIPAEDHIAYYPVLSLPSFDDYVGMTIYNYGNPNLVGRNVISKIEPYAEGSENGPGMFFNYDQPGVGSDETFLIIYDSGCPSFAVVDGKLALLGEHFSASDAGPPTASDGSWWSVDGFVPAYIDQLNARMGDDRVTVVAPEPSTLMLLAAAALALLVTRRMSSAP
jgi:hypothetical protein